MADDVIKSFLVALGFKVDEASLRKFNEQIKATEKSVKSFAIGFTAMAVGIEESIRRVGRQFEQLFYLSQQTGVAANTLKTMQFAFTQIGLSANDANQALGNLQKGFLDNPALKVSIQQWAPAFKAATGTVEDAFTAIKDRYAEIIAQQGVNGSLLETSYRNWLDSIHANKDVFRQLALNAKDFNDQQREAADILDAFGLNIKESTTLSQKAMQALGTVWFTLETAFNKLVVVAFPTVKALAVDFARWLKTEGAPMVKEWADRLKAWLDDPKSQQSFRDNLRKIGVAAKEVGKAIWWLIEMLGWLDSKIGATGTLLVALFGFTFAKAAIGGLTRGVITTLFAPLVSGAARAGAAAGTAFSGAQMTTVGLGFLKLARFAKFTMAGIIAGLAIDFLLTPDKPLEERKRAAEGRKPKGEIDKQFGAPGGFMDETFGRLGRYLSPYLPESMGGDPKGAKPGEYYTPDRPHQYSGPPMPTIAGASLDVLIFGFQHWWAGSGAFRPLVAFTEEVYQKLGDMLREVFSLAPGGESKGEGAGDTSTGPGSSRRAGVGGGGRMPGHVVGGSAAPGSLPTPGPTPEVSGEVDESLKTGIAFFMSKGMTREQATGVVARMAGESGGFKKLDPKVFGGYKGRAYGIVQALGSRRPAYLATGGDLMKQLEVAWGEMTGPEHVALAEILKAKTPHDAAVAMEKFERAKNPAFTEKAGKFAERLYGLTNAKAGTAAPAATPVAASLPAQAAELAKGAANKLLSQPPPGFTASDKPVGSPGTVTIDGKTYLPPGAKDVPHFSASHASHTRGGGHTDNRNSNNVTVHINGAKDPKEVGREVDQHLHRHRLKTASTSAKFLRTPIG